ncbi:cytochrome P450 [Biscogniauxia mediterranea]|nr:cytochrome P450 [Biscogniauxia mediterranea]
MKPLVEILQALPFPIAALYGGFLILTVLIWREFRSWYRLRHVPGPFLASISIIWMLRKALSGKLHEYLRDVSEQYGPLVRIGPNELLSTDPDVLRMMSAVRSSYTKGEFYETGRIIPEEDTVVSLRDDAAHRTLRAKMGTAFSGKKNEGFSFGAGIDRQIFELVKLIDNKYISSNTHYRPVQFFQKISYFTLDVIGDISFGGAFGYLREDCDLYNYHEISESSLPIMNVLSVMPWLTRVVYKWPFNMMLPKEGDRIGFGRLMGIAKSFVDKRLQPGANPQKDMMQAFINNGMTRSELMQQVFVQIIAGSISTTTAICMTLLCLITTPSAYRALQREIDEFLAVNKLSSPITDVDSRMMPYLQAVIREGLRIYPPVLGLGSKQVPRGGDLINGYSVPEGTQIGMNFFGLMRSKEIWGPDADIFRPERWLEADYDTLKKMNSVIDLGFGFGKYQCLGKPIAMMELNKIFVELIQRYDFMIVNPQAPIQARGAIFWSASDFWLRITKRSDTLIPKDRQQDKH